jgi:hypothetical protein
MIAATFHGPNHFRPNHDESTIEVFDNIGHAISALFERYDNKGEHNLPVRYLNGGKWRVPFPHVELGDWFQCYQINSAPVPQHIGNDAVLDALTAVHGDMWDYRLRLTRPLITAVDDMVSISVEKRVR